MKIVLIFLFILVILFLIVVWHSNISDYPRPKYNPIVVEGDGDDGDAKKICLTSEEKEKYDFYKGEYDFKKQEHINSQENLLIFNACKYTGTDWGYSHHNRALKDWIDLAKEYTDKNIKIGYIHTMCCGMGIKDDDFRVFITHVQFGIEKAKYEGDFSKESMENFILDIEID